MSNKSVPHCGLPQLLDVAFRPTGRMPSRWSQRFLCGLMSHLSPSTAVWGYSLEFVADLIFSGSLVWIQCGPGHVVCKVFNSSGTRFALTPLFEAISQVYPLEKPLWCGNFLDCRCAERRCKGLVSLFCGALCSSCPPLIHGHLREMIASWRAGLPKWGKSCILCF